MIFRDNAVDAVFLCMEGIEAEMVFYKTEDQDSGSKAQGKTEDVDQRICFSALQVTQGDLKNSCVAWWRGSKNVASYDDNVSWLNKRMFSTQRLSGAEQGCPFPDA